MVIFQIKNKERRKISKNRRVCLMITISIFSILIFNMSNAQTLNKAFLDSTVLISYKVDSKKTSSGTGFFVFREINNSQGYIFLITNKHALPLKGEEKSINIRVNTQVEQENKVKQIDIDIVGKDGDYLPCVGFHPNDKFDIAAINITELVIKHNIKGLWLPYSSFATKDILKKENISIGDEIFFLGYPDSIYDPRNVFPILRIGIISTMPIEGYSFNKRLRKQYGLPEKIDGFLIDAHVFPGSSGSLVILKPQIATVTSQGTIFDRTKKNPYLLGIISGSLPIFDTVLKSGQRMGIGIVYSADAIKETIEYFYERDTMFTN